MREHSEVGLLSLSLSRQSKEKDHQIRAVRVLSAMEHSFTAMQARTQARNCLAKAIKASHGPRVNPQLQAQEKVKKTLESPKDPSFSGNGKTLKTGVSDLENFKSETNLENLESVQMGQVCITETSWIHEEWSPDEWNDDGSCVGWHENSERMCFTRSAGDTFLVKFDREGEGDGNVYDKIPDIEVWQFQRYNEKCKLRSLNGRLADAHHVLGSNTLAFAATQATSDVQKVRCHAAETVVQRTTRFSCRIRWWLHDSDSQ